MEDALDLYEERREGAWEKIMRAPEGERDALVLDYLSAVLDTPGDEPWPSGADFLDWCAEAVALTGRPVG